MLTCTYVTSQEEWSGCYPPVTILDNWGVGGGGGGENASNVLGGGARNGMVLACPSTQRGQVRVELYGLRRTTFVDAHE